MRLLLALFLLAQGAEAPPEPRIVDLSTALDGHRVLVTFRLTDGFDQRLRERIASGLPTGFIYDLQLMRDRKRWLDAGLRSSRLEVVAMYNAVNREYLVNTKLDGKLIESRTLREISELERAMTEITALPVFSLHPSWGGQRLLVRARAEVGWNTLLGFIPWTSGTGWSNSRKFRAPGEIEAP